MIAWPGLFFFCFERSRCCPAGHEWAFKVIAVCARVWFEPACRDYRWICVAG